LDSSPGFKFAARTFFRARAPVPAVNQLPPYPISVELVRGRSTAYHAMDQNCRPQLRLPRHTLARSQDQYVAIGPMTTAL